MDPLATDEIIGAAATKERRPPEEDFDWLSAWVRLFDAPDYAATVEQEASRGLAAALRLTADPNVNGEALAIARAKAAVWSDILQWRSIKTAQLQAIAQSRARKAAEKAEDYVGQTLKEQWYDQPR